MLISNNRVLRVLSAVFLIIFSFYIRKQFIIFGLIYLFVNFGLKFSNRLLSFVNYLFFAVIVVSLVYLLVLDENISLVRDALNYDRTNILVSTLIDNYSNNYGIFYDFVNWLVTAFVVIIPWYFIPIGQDWHIPVYAMFTFMYVYIYHITREIIKTPRLFDAKFISALSVIISYMCMLFFYVPDYGAYSRYMVVIAPVFCWLLQSYKQIPYESHDNHSSPCYSQNSCSNKPII